MTDHADDTTTPPPPRRRTRVRVQELQVYDMPPRRARAADTPAGSDDTTPVEPIVRTRIPLARLRELALHGATVPTSAGGADARAAPAAYAPSRVSLDKLRERAHGGPTPARPAHAGVPVARDAQARLRERIEARVRGPVRRAGDARAQRSGEPRPDDSDT